MIGDFKESIKNIKASRPLISVQDIVTFIEKGEKYLKLSIEELDDDKEMEILQGIVLSPDYQRKYRSSIKEESSIIESLLVGIPIPEIFLVISSRNDAQIRHVMDGQHRLNAIYRYVNNKFPLKKLEILGNDSGYENKKFMDLEKKDKIKILGSHLSILEFESFQNPDIEIELFKRYNRNTKPLEMQEIEMATYFSETSKYISGFINELIEKDEKLSLIYNITQSRNDKQKNHQELCVILSVLEAGLNENVRDGVTASKNFLKVKSALYKNNEDENLEALKNDFNKFNEFILVLSNEIEYPFSTVILSGKKQRQSKFLMGVSIVLSTIYHYFEIDLTNPSLIHDVKKILSYSPLADVEYKASSTNMKYMLDYLFVKNCIMSEEFNSLKFKQIKMSDIHDYIGRIKA